jgi:hypothetical protein
LELSRKRISLQKNIKVNINKKSIKGSPTIKITQEMSIKTGRENDFTCLL